jgi:hypothetical protein
MTRWREWLGFGLAVAIVGFAYLARMVNITAQNLWIDEGFTWFLTQQPDLLRVLKTDVHPPLYFAAVSLWVRLVGTSELALRFFSVLPSVLSVACMIPLAREFSTLAPARPPTLKHTLPLMAAGLLAIADMEIYTAQEARGYALHTLLSIISVWAFLRFGRLMTTQGRTNTPRLKSFRATFFKKWQNLLPIAISIPVSSPFFTALVWVLATTALVYTHYLGAWLGVAQGLYALAFWRARARWGAVAGLSVAGASVLVWVLAIVLPYQLRIVGINTTADPSTPAVLFGYVRSFFSPQWGLLVGLAVMGLSWRAWRAHGLLALWLILPVALTFALNVNSRLLFDYRLSQITPSVALLVAWGLAWFDRRTRTFLLVVIAFSALLSVDVYRVKESWQAYAERVAQVVVAGDGVVVDFGGGDYQMSYYLARTLPADVPHYALRQEAFTYPETYEGDALGFMDSVRRVWLVRWNTNSEAFDKLGFVGYVQTAQEPLERANNINLDLMLFERAELR